MHPNLPVLHNLCCADVLNRFEKRKSAGGLGGSILVALIPTAVQTAIDLAVTAGGESVKALVADAKPAIRQFVSNNAVKFIEATLAGLEDVKSSADEGTPEPAPAAPTA